MDFLNEISLLDYDGESIEELNKSYEKIFCDKYNRIKLALSSEDISDHFSNLISDENLRKLKEILIRFVKTLMRQMRRFIDRAFSTNSLVKKRLSQVDKQLKALKHNLAKVKSTDYIDNFIVDIKRYDYDKLNTFILAGFTLGSGLYRNTSNSLSTELERYNFGDPALNSRFKVVISDIINFIFETFDVFSKVGVTSDSYEKAFKNILTTTVKTFREDVKFIIQQDYINQDFEEAIFELIDGANEDTGVGTQGIDLVISELERIQDFGRKFDAQKISDYFNKIQYNLERLSTSINNSSVDTEGSLPDGETSESMDTFITELNTLMINVQSNKSRVIGALFEGIDATIAEATNLIEIADIEI